MSLGRVAPLLLLVACFRAAPAPTSESAPAPPAFVVPAPDRSLDADLRFVERYVGGAQPGDEVPLIVAVHGLGDDPAHFAWILDGYPEPARVVLPQGPTPFGDGFAWMTVRMRDNAPEEQALQLAEAADRVAALIDAQAAAAPTRGRPVIVGFSQGGMVSWAVAARHPDRIAGAVPIAGFLPEPLWPEATGRVATVRALHGDADNVVPLSLDQRGVEALKARGLDVQIQVFAGVPHQVPRPVRSALFEATAGLTE